MTTKMKVTIHLQLNNAHIKKTFSISRFSYYVTNKQERNKIKTSVLIR